MCVRGTVRGRLVTPAVLGDRRDSAAKGEKIHMKQGRVEKQEQVEATVTAGMTGRVSVRLITMLEIYVLVYLCIYLFICDLAYLFSYVYLFMLLFITEKNYLGVMLR